MTTYHSLRRPFEYPADNLTIPQAFLDDALEHPSKTKSQKEYPFFIEELTGRKIWREECRRRTNQLAAMMQEKWGLQKGDIISLFAPNHVDYVVSVWAGHRLGCIIAPAPPALTSEELIYLLNLAKPSLIIAHSSNLAVALEAAKAIGFDQNRVITIDPNTQRNVEHISCLLKDGNVASRRFTDIQLGKGEAKTLVAFLCFSSGTTGKPKAVKISHYNLICNVLQSRVSSYEEDMNIPWEQQRFREGDVAIGVLPFYHIYGLVSVVHFMLYCKMTIVVSEKFDFAIMLQSIAKYKITDLPIVPPMAVLLCKHPAAEKADLSSVRHCLIAAAPASAELLQQLLQRLPDIMLGQGYGMTETTSALSVWPITQKVGTMGSAGQLFSGTCAKIVKPDGSLANYGEEGELWVTGPQIALGYYKNEEATKEVFVDGWVRTGDVALFQPNGDLYIVDRIKELIKVKGLQVAPAELEGQLLAHAEVADACVIGIPDDYSGEVPFAFVVLKPKYAGIVKNDPKGEKAEEIRKALFDHVAKDKSIFKWLTGGIEFVDALPKSPSGKILRRLMREKVKAIKTPSKAKL